MNISEISAVPLGQANLCVDCETITASHTACLVCGSKALLNIAKVLNNRYFAELAPALQSKAMQTAPARVFEKTAHNGHRTTGRIGRRRKVASRMDYYMESGNSA